MSSLEILFSRNGSGRWRCLVLRRPRGLTVAGFDAIGAAHDLDAPDFGELERLHPDIGYHRRDLPDGGICVRFPPSAVLGAIDWLEHAVARRFEQAG